MALSAGTRLGPYEILSSLGAGGMGEVYRARDTRLDRTVAIKILPSAGPELKARFEREARAIAALTHPHICTLYDVDLQHEADYLVMEYLDGQTLATRLERGPLKLGDVLKHAIEIADALDKAHRAGVIHRDLKPGNIMLTKGGAKLLDFGLAKLRPAEAGGIAGMTAVVTQSTPLTGRGSIVGTLQYMAPEQLEGRDADARSDLFALGTILYEMITGQKAFQGSSPASVIAAIMTAEPPISELQKLSPPGLEHLVKTCLVKSPEDRRQTAHDVVLQLEWIAGSHGELAIPSARPGRSGWRWMAAAVLLLLGVALGTTWYFTASEPVRHATSVSILPPENAQFEDLPAISPDGSRLAFSARGPSGQPVLWIRPLDASTPVPIGGTATAHDPFWSPDSRFVGFFAQGKMKRVSAEPAPAASPVQTLADAPNPRGGTWSPDGVIVFSRNIEDGLYRVPAAGGEVTRVTTLDRGKRENSHRWPQFLPDGRHILFLARSSVPEHQGIYVGTPGSKDWKLLLRTPLNALVAGGPKPALPASLFRAARGYLLFVREQTFVAQPFDLDRLELSGEPRPIAESVGTSINRSMFSVSANASLAYRTDDNEIARPSWFDRDGKLLGIAASGNSPRLSPDGRQLALERRDPRSGAGDIWLEDLSRRVSTRLTSHPAYDWIPIWSPDGHRIVFASNREGTMDLYEKAVGGSEPERQILKSEQRKTPTDWSRDGQFLLFDLEDPATGWDLAALPMNGDRKPFAILQSEFNETQGALSPDGKWLAYTSDETGASQVYVQPFNGRPVGGGSASSRKWRISGDGGAQPHWRSDGKELFYISLDRNIVSVPVKTGPAFEVGTAAPLFASTLRLSSDSTLSEYDITADGKRFVITVSDDRHPAPLTLLLNWTAALNRGR
jgi:eukaryotic-like serine/threonine-protein kinase